jgi:hypothetical protein
MPKMVSDFGTGARVAEIQVSSDDIIYEVIGTDGLRQPLAKFLPLGYKLAREFAQEN